MTHGDQHSASIYHVMCFGTARVLASHGARVVMACRSRERAERAKADIIRKLTDPKDESVNFKHLKSEQLEERIKIMLLVQSVDKFAKEFRNNYVHLGLHVNL